MPSAAVCAVSATPRKQNVSKGESAKNAQGRNFVNCELRGFACLDEWALELNGPHEQWLWGQWRGGRQRDSVAVVTLQFEFFVPTDFGGSMVRSTRREFRISCSRTKHHLPDRRVQHGLPCTPSGSCSRKGRLKKQSEPWENNRAKPCVVPHSEEPYLRVFKLIRKLTSNM